MTTATGTHNKPAPRWASPEEAGDYIGVNKMTIRRMIARGDITGYRMGPRFIRVDLNDLDAMLRPIPTVQAGA